jgi:HPt (histidine-containing phosphotransfer) domain-containing protein
MQEYIRLLHSDIECELQRLNRAIAEEDRQEIEAAAHSLKGLCCNLHDKHPAALASRLHKCAQIAPVDELHHLVEQLLHLAQKETKPLAD